MVKQIFVNLPVKDLKQSIGFFTKLGFKFNPQFTDNKATCMIIGENIFAMLLVESYFKTFTPKSVSDAKKSTEVLLSLSLENKKQVDEFVGNTIAAGGKEPRKAQDYGWMYQRSIEDLDGHIWELFFMDESKMPKEMKEKGGNTS